MTVRIGHIRYANCTPIFTALQEGGSCGGYEFVQGVPSELNALLRRGEIDLCPASSIEYAMSPQNYFLLPGLSISSVGPVKSVLLFSRLPLEELDGTSIGLTTDSDTSVNLLKIILGKQFGNRVELKRTPLPLHEALTTFSALLLIGDAALRENMLCHGYHVYDLGELWYRYTGLPFVFALWLVTRSAVQQKRQEVARLSSRLLDAKRRAYESYSAIADSCAEAQWMSRDALVDYWRVISYELTPQHLQGVATFYRYAAELGILAGEPELCLFEV